MSWFERIRLCLEGGLIGYMVGALFGVRNWHAAFIGMIALAAMQLTPIFDRDEQGTSHDHR